METANDELLTLEQLCEITGRSVNSIRKLLCKRNLRQFVKSGLKVDKRRFLKFSPDAVDYILSLDRANPDKESKQPDDAVHVTDPLGVYDGFFVTEEEAIRIAEIRILKRLEGNNEDGVYCLLEQLKRSRNNANHGRR